jgi:RND family efflux transporter MFP subunit
MKNFFKKKRFLIFLLIFLILGYFVYKNYSNKDNNSNSFIIEKVEKGEIQKIVSGSGNFVSKDSLKIISKKGGEIIYFKVDEGDYVRKGDLLVEIDSQDISRQIRDLKLDLNSQINNLEKLKIQKVDLENNLKKLNIQYEALLRQDDLKKIYEQNLPLLNNLFSKLPIYLKDIENVYFSKDIPNYDNNIKYYLSYFDNNYKNNNQYQLEDHLNNFKSKFQNLSNDFSQIKTNQRLDFEFLNKTYQLSFDIQNFIKIGLDLIRKIQEETLLKNAKHTYEDLLNNHYNLLKNDYDSLNNFNQSLIDILNRFKNYNDNIQSLLIDIQNTKNQLNQIETDIKNSEINIEKTKNKIIDLEKDLNDYKIYSPIDGVVNNINFKKGDFISPNSLLMNINSQVKLVEIKLNEIDIPEVKIGQEALLTFDALPQKIFKGRVIQIDPIGEISQGVVSYSVKILLNNNYKEILEGMTVNADIIIDSKKDVLVVPNSAIKTIENKKYVEVPDERENLNLQNNKPLVLKYPPKIAFIKTGLNDSKNTEILEGLKEGDFVILRKIGGDNKSNQTSQNQQGLFQRLTPQPRQFIRSPNNR